MGFNLNDYEDVATRIPKFWADHQNGRIVTSLVSEATGQGERWIVKASLYRDDSDTPFATGYAFEVDGQGNVNKTSALENCETSAIGRALANAGYGAKDKPRASKQEMAKVKPSNGLPPCPECKCDVKKTDEGFSCTFCDWKTTEQPKVETRAVQAISTLRTETKGKDVEIVETKGELV